jgi:hypothetical protein
VRATPSHLRHLLVRTYSQERQPHVSKDELDDLLILDSWLRNHREEVTEVAVDIDKPAEAAPALREAILGASAGSRAQPATVPAAPS